ncbi:manganese-dependent inorganic pyrophosphatase [Leuconostoc gelidum subsp. gelidum]|uniref:Manganese-dependent inorganic pyrophosphatase n=1 Tax=Leuconostoc gelidum subsp. gelidum TaxID=1607839 RepID=A0ABS7V3I3_LEUGE|nr:manganese-dependent inorganic pyrophosphatase [Leuconostoc gelidum]MBZ5964278.1 manganese-dependent inorganic pyrophosphatase [Leuconostoc gelidum subsp. gelidum]MBZ5975123.1 manganese-dependent inorganic pyrophosphatase [Leuconostoc gelidum subsp. gelidum]MBZ5976927.1 manganese-dependent inorganic pyrophosphatase [Leuconostoc gelidum subsp. gelidum]MBZ5986870.1 manganese-dependent inorganic pyrophosphatase [Leuconostoc gelidum subsp. gelidum]MBZ5999654.1 manganese-dependent inorganic pyrop
MAKTLVFGHKNPDTDTIASAIAASYLLNELGGDTEAVAQGTPNAETQFALDFFSVTAPKIITSADTETVVLVDHNEATQSIDNLSEVIVEGIYDHHKFSFTNSTPLYINAKPWGSVATILYYEFKQADINIPSKIAGLMASAIISDTLLLKSPTTTSYDTPALEDLAAIAGLDDYEKYGLSLLKAGTDLSSRTDKELIDGDAKSFEIGGHKFRIGQVNTVDIADVLTRQSGIEAAMIAEGYEDFLFVITDILNSNSKALYLGDATTSIESAFGAKISNNVIDLPGVVSRKKQVVPPLEKQF